MMIGGPPTEGKTWNEPSKSVIPSTIMYCGKIYRDEVLLIILTRFLVISWSGEMEASSRLEFLT